MANTANKNITGIPQTCRIPEAQNMLHCSYRHVQELMYSGQLKYYKAGKRLVLIDLDSLRKLFEVPANSAVLKSGVGK